MKSNRSTQFYTALNQAELRYLLDEIAERKDDTSREIRRRAIEELRRRGA